MGSAMAIAGQLSLQLGGDRGSSIQLVVLQIAGKHFLAAAAGFHLEVLREHDLSSSDALLRELAPSCTLSAGRSIFEAKENTKKAVAERGRKKHICKF